MKKFFAFVLAMAVSAVANAGLVTFGIHGSTIDWASGVITLKVVSDVPVIRVDAVATITCGEAEWISITYSPRANQNFTPEYNGNVAEFSTGSPYGLDSANIAEIKIQYSGVGILNVELSEGQDHGGSLARDSSAVQVSGMFTIVPEPITMAILGAGGLLVVRRRAL